MLDLALLAAYREGDHLEAKAAQGGLPKSVWETYSAFANTTGGLILLGVKELSDHCLMPVGLVDAPRMAKEFWDALHGRQVVSANILTPDDVHIENVDGVDVLCIAVPQAQSADRPVFIRDNPFTGSYRRNGEGDYRCSRDEVKAMLRDSETDSADKRLVVSKGLDSLCVDTITSYRRGLRTLRPQHPWNNLSDEDFLVRIEAAGLSPDDSLLHPTKAGLLMFGWEYEITSEFPFYFLDYREVLSERRWDDRIISSSGEWSGNVFDFWGKVAAKLVSDLPRPFEMDGLYRREDTPMHRALREGLANMLLHADYYGGVNSVVVRYDDRVVFSNAGVPLISIGVAEAGGTSKTRNPSLMKMFNLISIGERAGSGFDTMRRGCEWAGSPAPEFRESFAPDKTTLELFLAARTPSIDASNDGKYAVLSGNDDRDGAKAEKGVILPLAPEEAAIDLATRRGILRRSDVEAMLGVSKATATNMLNALVSQGKLARFGSGPSTRYRLP